MDEPTNHLDLASKEVLEEALSAFTGTIVFISHDRYFINRIATRVVEVDAGRLTTSLGSYDDYLASKSRPVAREPAPAATPRREAVPRRDARPPALPGAAAPPTRKQLEREIRVIQSRLDAVEKEVHEMEGRLEEIGLALADPDLYRDGERARAVAQFRKETEERVAWLMKEWEDLSLRLSSVKSGL
jgi:ATP-binding cassette subfamily F protein 3